MKGKLAKTLPAKCPGKVAESLRIKIIQTKEHFIFVQKKQVQSLVDEIGLTDCHKTAISCDVSAILSTTENEDADRNYPYGRVIGILLYIALVT